MYFFIVEHVCFQVTECSSTTRHSMYVEFSTRLLIELASLHPCEHGVANTQGLVRFQYVT